MADNSEPTGQQRAVDPFSSYNSNIVNQLTRIKTYAGGAINGVIAINNDLQVELDPTASLDKIVVSRGIAYKDDMFLRLSSDHIVDFDDLTQYVNPTNGRSEAGYYYVVLEYIYVKSRPAPTFKIKIIKPTQRAGYNWSSPSSHPFVFLKAVKHVEVGSPGSGDMKIDLSDPLFDIDPEDSEAKRRYIREYAGTESDLPTFNAARDASRIVYDVDTDKFWFGYKDKWGEVGEGGSIISLDTSGMSEGDLCYINSSGTCTKAISTALNTGADIVVKDVGGAGVGKGITSGIGLNVPVEGAISVTRGDLLYLSDTEDGKVTTTRPDAYFQVVGRSLTTSSGYVDIIFSPKLVLTLGVEGNLSSWSGPTSGLYYADIDISNLETSYGVHASFFDTSDLTQITPAEIQIISGGDTLRVFFPINTLSINYVITSEDAYGCGGGGGGGVLDHSALVNLSYATSGHIGFSPNPHPNSHHSDPASIPSGAIILFESDVAITGYSLLTTYDDGLVYITKGSGAAGESGATNKLGSTWSQPSHQHTGPNHQHDLSNHQHIVSGITGGPSGGARDEGGGSNTCANQNHTHNLSFNTGAPDIDLTSFSGTGLTGSSATANSWRPKGRNFTRQQKI